MLRQHIITLCTRNPMIWMFIWTALSSVLNVNIFIPPSESSVSSFIVSTTPLTPTRVGNKQNFNYNYNYNHNHNHNMNTFLQSAPPPSGDHPPPTSSPSTSPIDIDKDKTTKEELENDLLLIEAIEERNRSQIYSFMDEKDQWEAMEEDERQLLLRKDDILEQLAQLQSKSQSKLKSE